MTGWLRAFGSLVVSDLRQFYRVRLIVLSSSLMPVAMTLSFGLGEGASGSAPAFGFIFPGILALATMFSALFSGGYGIILDRQQSVIRDLMLSPVSYSAYVMARLLGVALKSTPPLGLSLLCALPFLAEWRPAHPFVALAAYLLSALLFAAVGMWIGSFSNVMTFPGLANFVLMPCMFFCGVFFPVADLGRLQALVQALPFTSTVALYRHALTGAPLPAVAGQLALLAFDTAAIVALWTWIFKRRVVSEP